MSLAGNIGFDLVSDHDLIQFRAPIDVNLRFFAVCVLDRILFALHIHQGVFGQRLPSCRFCLDVRHRIGCCNDPGSKTKCDDRQHWQHQIFHSSYSLTAKRRKYERVSYIRETHGTGEIPRRKYVTNCTQEGPSSCAISLFFPPALLLGLWTLLRGHPKLGRLLGCAPRFFLYQ